MNDTADSAREVTLHNGLTMPTLAFGCAFGDWVGTTEFQGFLPEQAWRAVSLALENGYRAFDGARAYGTERIVGTLLGQRFVSGAFGMLRAPALARIADRHGKTSGQVVLRWHVQSGRTALPKTSKAKRMAENREIYDFELSDDEMRTIGALGGGEARRTCPDPSTDA